MSLEIPTLMSAVGVNTEIIQQGMNGMLFSNEEEFYLQLRQLIEDPEGRERLGKNGRKTVVEKYSVLANRDKYLELIRSVAAGKQ
jgi:glycosyltransferase involved in cell wall biosynthesis